MIPNARVSALLHAGPHDGEVVLIPWARLEIPMIHWELEEVVVSLYRLRPPWRGQDDADYDFVDEQPSPGDGNQQDRST